MVTYLVPNWQKLKPEKEMINNLSEPLLKTKDPETTRLQTLLQELKD